MFFLTAVRSHRWVFEGSDLPGVFQKVLSSSCELLGNFFLPLIILAMIAAW